MAGTSVPAVIDYLVDKLSNGFTSPADTPGGARTVPPLSAIDANVEVTDGPATTSAGPWVTVGFAGPQQDTNIPVVAEYMVFGRQRIDEQYTVLVDVIANGPEGQQSGTRLAVAALHDAIVNCVWADPTFGGILNMGHWAHVAQAAWIQPPPSTGSGSTAAVQMTIAVKNSYVP